MATVPVSQQVLNAAIQGISLITQIVTQREQGEITEEAALEALGAAQQGVKDAFAAFKAAPDGGDAA